VSEGFERGLPANIDAERSILGAILLDEKALDEAQSVLHASDLALDSHRRIFGAMLKLSRLEKTVDLVTLPAALVDSGEIEAVGGMAYLFSLTEGLPRRISIGAYVKIVKEKSQLRQLIGICESAITRAGDQDEALSVINGIQDGLQEVLDDSQTDEPLVQAYSVDALNAFHAARKLERSPGLSYGNPELDEFTGGMMDGEVTLVGARSGVGKTSEMCQAVAANCVVEIPSHIFSLEMTRPQILRRLWSIVSGVPYKVISEPWRANADHVERIQNAAAQVATWPLRIHDQSELHLSKIIGLARVSMRRFGTRFVAVDYAQEVAAEGRDERTKVMAVAKGLAGMIKHEKASLMLLSQLVKMNRESYNKPPMVGDFIESGKLENVAHVILMLHRGWDEESSRISDEAEIIIPKQRRGETGVLRARFNRRTLTFEGV
jgi:replicative DNA helicase